MAEIDDVRANAGGRISLFHVVVVCLSMTLAIAAWKFSVSQMDTRIMNRFVLARDRALGLVVDRITRYEDALWAGTAAIESLGGDISLQEWQTFANSLRIEEKYPGINGIGVIHYQTPLSLDGFLAEQRDARPTFRLYPQHDQPFLMPITYIEPVRLNSQAVGLDVAHEVNRRTAALLARDTGTAQITGPIVLVQDAGNTPGFLFTPPSTAAARQTMYPNERTGFLALSTHLSSCTS